MTSRDLLLAFKAGNLSKDEVREKLRALHNAPPRCPLSEGQRGLWALQKLAPELRIYNVPLCFHLGPELDVARLQRACRLLLEYVPVLSTVFGEEDGVPFQTEQSSPPVYFIQEDISALDASAVLPHIYCRAGHPFGLAQGSLTRFQLFTRAVGAGVEHLFLITVHHIIFDGASVVPLVTTLFDAYSDLASGREPAPPLSSAPYSDFVAWERRLLSSERGAEHLTYWARQLAGPLPTLDLPTDRPHWAPGASEVTSTPSPRHEAYRITQRLPDELAGALKSFAASRDIGLPIVLLEILVVLLHRYTGQDEIIVGMPTIGRPHESFDSAIGYFVNMIAIRARTQGRRSFADLLEALQLTLVDGLDHAAYPFPALVRELNLPRQAGRPPVFQVAFAYQSFLRSGSLQELLQRYRDTLTIELVADVSQESVYEIELQVFEADGGIDLHFNYQRELYDGGTVAGMMADYLRLAGRLIEAPDQPLDTYAPLRPAALKPPLPEGEGTGGFCRIERLPADVCLHEVFAAQARATPDAVAVTYEGQSLTYRALEARSTALALYLQQHGVEPESLVGLSMAPSPEMVVGLLGILKAGGAYVPLDPTYPAERLAYMIRDSGVRLLLTHARQVALLAALGQEVRTIALDTDWPEVEQVALTGALHGLGEPQRLAYVIYTSGSTGTPKGTLVQHDHVVRLFATTDRLFHFGSGDVWTLFHSLSFDFSVWELWGALLYGGCLVVVPEAVRHSPRELYDLLRREQVTVLNQVPSAFWPLSRVMQAAGPQALPLRYVMFGGEALPIPRLQPWFAQFGDTPPQLINMYGITETTVHVTYHQVTPAETAEAVSRIGRALPDLTLDVLDRDGQPTPPGVPGEMHVGGAGVSRGYLHRPGLTAERFLPDPCAPGGRRYRTGDVACWHPDAWGQPCDLEYLGRIDDQVKIRGFRIELGDIEHQMLQHALIRDAVVVARAGETSTEPPQLVAYYVPAQPGVVSSRQVREHLQAALPAYMIPAMWVELETIPRTLSGKIDRKALSARHSASTEERVIVPPQSEIEARVLAIWQAVLRTEQVGVDDGFFDVGGDSLRLVAVAERLRQELGADLGPAALFKYVTVRALSAHLEAVRQGATAGLEDEATAAAINPPSEPALASMHQRGVADTVAPRCAPHERIDTSSTGQWKAVAVAAPTSPPDGPAYLDGSLAIVGISCQFPGAPDHRTFWRNLCSGQAAGRFFTEVELKGFGLAEELVHHPHLVPLQLTIDDKDCFDPAFFNISRRDAALMDPQARLLLQHAWKVLEDAGYTPDQVPETGVYMSAGNTFYQTPWMEPAAGDVKVMGHSSEYVAWMFAQGGSIPTMISHKLALRGPSLFVHSNCSSSLVGLHLACQSLKLKEIDLALVGAALIFPTTQLGYLHRDDLNFSSTGRCRPFDAAADGMVGGEGVAVVALKRAVDAVRDRDQIYALIRGIGVNNDGADKVGFYAPSVNGQSRVIQRVLEATGIDPASIGYVEAHGTGTRLGDPVELSALSDVYQRYTMNRQFCGIGSVKSNIGHMDTAAGLAGCIKVALSLYHGEIPPSIHYERPNPAIDFANSPFYVVDRLLPWESAVPHRAALSSFGIGGTNAHAIFEQCPVLVDHRHARLAPAPRGLLVPLSAKNHDRLRDYARALAAFLASSDGEHVVLADLAYTFQVGRRPMPARVVFLATNRDELLRKLEHYVDGAAGLEGVFVEEANENFLSETGPLLADDGDRQVLLGKWLAERDVRKLARSWVQGCDIDWALLYEGDAPANKPRRVSLPTYPFAKERYGWPEPFDAERGATQPEAAGSPDALLPLPPGEGTKGLPRKDSTPAYSRGHVTTGGSTESLAGMLLLQPVWDPTPAQARRGPVCPAASERLLIVGGDDEATRAVLQYFPTARVCDVDTVDSVEDAVARLREHTSQPIDHLLWLCPPAADDVVGDTLIDRAHRRILSCFRTIKALLRLGYGVRDLTWTVVTTGAVAVHQDEPVDPSQAALHGLIGSMSREHLRWNVRVVDVGPGDRPMLPALSELFSLPADSSEGTWACRVPGTGMATQWYRQRMIPLDCAPASATIAPLYRDGGVYVVIGGAGTVGRAWSEHVIRRAGARVVWIGRRPLDATIQVAIDALAKLGPAPLYVSADAADGRDLARALQFIRQQGLAVNGVVHSAVTMASGALAELDEERFRAGLRSKVDINAHLALLSQSEPLDFLLFFSSIVSFTTHPRQSSYAAGCLFADALAHQLARQWPCAIKSVNWGYWGSSGAVPTSPAALSQMAREGIAPIGPEEGMAALDTVLGGPLPRLAVVKTTNAAGLDGLHVSSDERAVVYPEATALGLAALHHLVGMPVVSVDAGGGSAFERLTPEWGVRTDDLDSILCRLTLVQLQTTDLLDFSVPGARASMSATPAKLVEPYGRWLEAAVAFLVEHGFLSYETANGSLSMAPDASAAALETAWQEWDRRKTAWLEDPYKAALVVLVEATLRALPDILSGRRLATDVIYPNSSMALVEATRQHNRVADYFNSVLADAVVASIRGASQGAAPQSQGLRILEIGAGIGGSSRVIFQALRQAGLQGAIGEYCYSDVSRAFLTHGERQYGADNPFLTYRLLDIEKPIALQGFEEGSYDLVIAANVLHATRDIRRTLRHTKTALKPGGLLLLHEIARRSLYSHLTFGLLPGWWLFEDEGLRLSGTPALSPDAWRCVLEEAGYRGVLFPVSEAHGLGLQIIIAESDGLGRRRFERATAPAAASMAAKAVGESRADAHGTHESNRPLLVSRVSGAIVEQLAAALKMAPEEIAPHVPFADYGLDSILAVDVIDAINRTLAIDLRTTSVFDHSTVERLTAHILILTHYPDTIGPAQTGGDMPPAQEHTPPANSLSPRERARVRAAPNRLTVPIPLTPPSPEGRVSPDPVAVIGMAGQFPDADDVETFWRNLLTGHDAVRPYLPSDAAPTDTPQWAGIVEARDCFDPLFFNIAPREALSMSLHQRLVLQESWKALEDAGYNPRSLSETQVGMFIGAEPAEYFYETFTGASDAIVASRLAYVLNLNGPALVVNTACSSSATAIHLACESLRRGESSIALAGGVAAPMDYANLLRLQEVGMLSPHGHCHPFDASADGTVLSEGVGIVVLKRLREAIADGDHVYGVILGSGMNQDGASNGITAPNGQAQERLITSVYQRYGIDPQDISYVEAHGTGTKLGDPIEANALARAFRQFTNRERYCAIGSAKAHVGHTTAAAGVIGLIKILLSFRHRCIPGLLHFDRLNPHIELDHTPFYINTEPLEWRSEALHTAALSSFGHSGTNVHLVVQEYPTAAPAPSHHGPFLMPLSAKNGERLRDYAGKLLAFLHDAPAAVSDLAAMAYTLQIGREAMDERVLFLVHDIGELSAGLLAYLSGEQHSGRYWRGSARQARDFVGLFAADDELNGLVAQWAASSKRDKLAELWARGVAIDWGTLYGADQPFGPRPGRLSLPTYAFARERYDKPTSVATRVFRGHATAGTPALPGTLHPLLHRNTSNLAEQRFSSTFTGREFFLDHHRVRGQRVLPGVAYLEMAREAVSQALAGVEGFVDREICRPA